MRYALALLGLLLFTTAAHAEAETAYDRVIRTGVIRCGYISWPEFIDVDPNTGKLSGFWYDFVESVAASLHLKVDWNMEVPYPDIGAALATGKIDAYCQLLAPLPDRLRSATFTRPIIYIPLGIYARVDNTRLIGHPEKLDDPETRIVAVEGEAASVMARASFPHAKLQEVQNMTGPDQVFQDIISGKADVTFAIAPTFAAFDAANPGKLAAVTDKPLGVLAGSMAVPLSDRKLADLLDFATDDYYNTGKFLALVHSYGMEKKLLVRTTPYMSVSP